MDRNVKNKNSVDIVVFIRNMSVAEVRQAMLELKLCMRERVGGGEGER